MQRLLHAGEQPQAAVADGVEAQKRRAQRLLARRVVQLRKMAADGRQLERGVRILHRAETLVRFTVFMEQPRAVQARERDDLIDHGVEGGHEEARPVVQRVVQVGDEQFFLHGGHFLVKYCVG